MGLPREHRHRTSQHTVALRREVISAPPPPRSTPTCARLHLWLPPCSPTVCAVPALVVPLLHMFAITGFCLCPLGAHGSSCRWAPLAFGFPLTSPSLLGPLTIIGHTRVPGPQHFQGCFREHFCLQTASAQGEGQLLSVRGHTITGRVSVR